MKTDYAEPSPAPNSTDLASPAFSGVPKGWLITAEADGKLKIVSPKNGPGWLWCGEDDRQHSRRVLYAFASALLAAPPKRQTKLPSDIDQIALDAALRCTPENDPKTRAEMQCRIIAAIKGESYAKHLDDAAVDRFAVAMKNKLAAARAKGRGGWDGSECNSQRLSDMLRAHVEKGDPRDVANFCMFLHERGEAIQPAKEVHNG